MFSRFFNFLNFLILLFLSFLGVRYGFVAFLISFLIFLFLNFLTISFFDFHFPLLNWFLFSCYLLSKVTFKVYFTCYFSFPPIKYILNFIYIYIQSFLNSIYGFYHSFLNYIYGFYFSFLNYINGFYQFFLNDIYPNLGFYLFNGFYFGAMVSVVIWWLFFAVDCPADPNFLYVMKHHGPSVALCL